MSGWIPPRLRSLIGNDLANVDSDDLENLVGLSEGQELEFKSQMPEPTPANRKQFAHNLAQFANASGGLIVIGITEDGLGRAAELSGFEATEEPEIWINQIAADRIFPRISMSTKRVEIGHRIAVLISIPRSRHPHAVPGDDGVLKFPVRLGPQRSWLTEAELSERYARRYRNLVAVESRLDGLESAMASAIPVGSYPEKPRSFLAICAVPEDSGVLELHGGLTEEYRLMLNRELTHFPGTHVNDISVRPGFRSLQIGTCKSDRFVRDRGDLNLDGGGYLLLGDYSDVLANTNLIVVDEYVFADLVNGLRTLATHASVSGSLGTLNISCQLATRSAAALQLFKIAGRGKRPAGDTTPVCAPWPITRRSFGIEALVDDPPSLISAVRLIASDLFSAFGVSEPRQAGIGGELLQNGFGLESRQEVAAWASGNGVKIG